jgi:hypothetical protein
VSQNRCFDNNSIGLSVISGSVDILTLKFFSLKKQELAIF